MLFVVRLTAVALVLGGVVGGGPRARVVAPEVRGQGVPTGSSDVEHRYRIAGKVRLLFVWLGADDVGSARAAWRGSASDRSIALLIGSEPRRAPRGVNEWGYVLEYAEGDATMVFELRTVTDGDSPAEADGRRATAGERVELGVLCSRVTPVEAVSHTTSMHVRRDTTYRDVDDVLESVAGDSGWKSIVTKLPPGVSPGFVTALDLMMRSSAASARASDAAPSCSRVPFVYNDVIYDLVPRRVDRLPLLRTRTGTLTNLLRADVGVRNRRTGHTTGFTVTYGTDGDLAGIPVAATYQPNWWFKVVLELDDDQEVPPDPAGDRGTLDRIVALCSQPWE